MHRLSTILLAMSLATLVPQTSIAQDSDVVSEVRALYQSLEYEVAETRARRAIEQANVATVDDLAQLHALLALIYFVQQEQQKARSEFRLALSLAPDLELDPFLVPPRAMAFFDELRERRFDQADSGLSLFPRYVVLVDPRPGAAMRSLILPGWGQWHKGEQTKGTLLATAYLSLAAGAGYRHLSSVGESHTGRNLLVGAAAAVWMFSYFDALLADAPGRYELASRIALIPAVSPDGFGFAAQVQF